MTTVIQNKTASIKLTCSTIVIVLIIAIIIVISLYLYFTVIYCSFHTNDGRGNCRNVSAVKLRSVVLFLKLIQDSRPFGIILIIILIIIIIIIIIINDF